MSIIYETKVTSTVIREISYPGADLEADTPEKVVAAWQNFVTQCTWHDPLKEAMVVWNLNTRNQILDFNLVSLGTLNATLTHPREVFRPAIVCGACSIIITHNHPSGDPTPSEADIKATREIKRAGDLLRIELLDHVVIGKPSNSTKDSIRSACHATVRRQGFASLREMGYLYS